MESTIGLWKAGRAFTIRQVRYEGSFSRGEVPSDILENFMTELFKRSAFWAGGGVEATRIT
jgi:hypothetical protein